MSKKKKTNEICINKHQLEKINDAIIELEFDDIEVTEIYIYIENENVKVNIPYSFSKSDVKEITL